MFLVEMFQSLVVTEVVSLAWLVALFVAEEPLLAVLALSVLAGGYKLFEAS
jgi:hypothetical protein